jgi:hypothetical protein
VIDVTPPVTGSNVLVYVSVARTEPDAENVWSTTRSCRPRLSKPSPTRSVGVPASAAATCAAVVLVVSVRPLDSDPKYVVVTSRPPPCGRLS